MYIINIPKNVYIYWGSNFIKVTGILGSVIKKKADFELAQENSTLYVFTNKSQDNLQFYVSMIQKLILGVSKGFRHKLKLVGVGFRAKIEKKKLILKIGYSHDVIYNIPNDIQIYNGKVKGIFLLIKGKELYRVNQISSEIRALRKPDIYKGKGIHKQNEILKLKKGKREGK